MKRKLAQYSIYKFETDKLCESNGKTIKVIPIAVTERMAIENGELVNIQNNQLTNAIKEYYGMKNISKSFFIDKIVNIHVNPESKKQGEREYQKLAEHGFTVNNIRFVRILSGSGQIRNNTITFIREDLYEPIIKTLLCGLEFSDFGEDFNAAKYNAYSGLNMSGCHLLPFELNPRVCIIDDYEAIRPGNIVNHVTEKDVKYIALPDGDLILEDSTTDFEIVGQKAVRKSDGVEFNIYKGIHKMIDEKPYNEIAGSPELNSFDGQGIMSPEWAKKVSDYLGYGYIPSEMIIRAPWVKGLLATIPFHEYFSERGITEVTDAFGKVRKIEEIDCFISKSQFKMFKIYKSKCAGTGINPWDYHVDSMEKNKLHWGVVKPNGKKDDEEKALNYQYLQALQLDNDDIEALCIRTKEFLEKLNSGDIQEVYSNLVVHNKQFEDLENDNSKKLFQKAIECNPEFINDRYIRNLIFKECESKMNGAKLGKLLIRGNFQFCVSDPLAQLQWIEKNHCHRDVDVVGMVPAGYIYSNYWFNASDRTDEIVLMRSPLIDRNEIAKRKLITETCEWFRYLNSGIIMSIHDLTPLQEGGCDFDGDIIYSTNNQIVAKGCYSYEQAKPLYYSLDSTDLTGAITQENIVKADIRGLNSKVGTISNKAGTLYAMLELYTPDSMEYKKIYDSIVALGQIVGMEIDRIKTAIYPTMPFEWDSLQIRSKQTADGERIRMMSDDETEGIFMHNNLVPIIKPYYFRHNYMYIDDAIKQLDRVFNEVSSMNYGLKMEALIEKCNTGEANEEMIQLYEQYKRAYPVIDTDCVVNHVCHFFEKFETELAKRVKSDGVNMLKQYVESDKLDMNKLDEIKTMLSGYTRFKRMAVKSNNAATSVNNGALKKKAYNTMDMVRGYYQDLILQAFDGDVQKAFDYLVKAADSESIVWEILDVYILSIIKNEVA